MSGPNPTHRLSSEAPPSHHRPSSIRSNLSATATGSPPAQQPEQTTTATSSSSPQPHATNTVPSFSPFYALVTDTTPSTRSAAAPTTHHPHVHYLFSDDDPDSLSEALTSSSEGNSQHPVLLLDVVPTDDDNASLGYTVSGACSLSSSWAVTSAQLSQMPSTASAEDSDPAGSSGSGPAFMLRIEGVGVDAVPSSAPPPPAEKELGGSSSGGSSGGGLQARGGVQEDYGALIEEFDRRMAVLRRVVGAGEEWRRRRQGEMGGAAEGPLQRPAAVEGHATEGRDSGARSRGDGD